MCGIVGWINSRIDKKVDSRILQMMNSTLAHCGSDGEGYFIENNVGLAHRASALSIPLQVKDSPYSMKIKAFVSFKTEKFIITPS